MGLHSTTCGSRVESACVPGRRSGLSKRAFSSLLHAVVWCYTCPAALLALTLALTSTLRPRESRSQAAPAVPAPPSHRAGRETRLPAARRPVPRRRQCSGRSRRTAAFRCGGHGTARQEFCRCVESARCAYEPMNRKPLHTLFDPTRQQNYGQVFRCALRLLRT